MRRRPRLPSQLTSFVGRSADLERLGQLLARGVRLVTLFGPGGIGKTRLVLRLGEAHADRAWFFDLTHARDLEEVCGIVGRELGAPTPAAGPSAVEAIGGAIAALGPVLLLLDNCERVAPDLAAAIEQWCGAAESAQFVATSRELLRLPFEHAYELAPLGVPQAGGDVAASDAVQLFVERAALTRGGYVLEASEADTVAAIVRRLDGLPLGIELAAARMGVLGADELLDRLAGRLDIGAVRRGASTRQATLRATLDWSWDLLLPWEQAALAQCSCFRGGLSLRAAEAVLDLRAYPDAPTPLDVIQSLRDKSLLRTISAAGTPRQLRLGLYDTVQEYARGKLEERGDGAAALARHEAFFVRVAERWVSHGMRRRAPDDLAMLVVELDNLLAAHERARAASPLGLREALLTALAAEAALSLRGDIRAAHRLLDDVVAAAGADPSEPGLVSLALSARCRTQQCAGLYNEVWTNLDRAVALARRAGDRVAEGRAIAGLGLLGSHAWDPAVTQEHLHRAIELHRATGDIAAEVRALLSLGSLAHNLGRREEASVHGAAALERARETGDPEQVAFCVGFLGIVDLGLGRPEAALAKMDEAIALLRGLGAVPFYLAESGLAAQELGRWEDAEARYREAISQPQPTAQTYSVAAAYGYLAMLFHERGDLERALAGYEEALEIVKSAPASSGIHGLLRASYGALLAKLGRVADATCELDAAEAMFADHGEEWTEFVSVHRGQLDLAQAAAREAAGDAREAERLRAHASGRLRDGPAGEDLRLARRLLARELERPVSAPDGAREDVLVVGPEARWFRFRAGPAVDLGKRRAVRLLLGALVQARTTRPGEPVRAAELVGIGWRGERMSQSAGMNRLRVALSELRSMGLRDAIANKWDGYMLAPTVHVAFSEEPVPAEI